MFKALRLQAEQEHRVTCRVALGIRTNSWPWLEAPEGFPRYQAEHHTNTSRIMSPLQQQTFYSPQFARCSVRRLPGSVSGGAIVSPEPPRSIDASQTADNIAHEAIQRTQAIALIVKLVLTER